VALEAGALADDDVGEADDDSVVEELATALEQGRTAIDVELIFWFPVLLLEFAVLFCVMWFVPVNVKGFCFDTGIPVVGIRITKEC